MGIDPGTNFTGYGVIEVIDKKVTLVALGYIDLKGYKDPYLKLRHIFERVTGLIDSYLPDEMAFESPFFGENIQSMLKLGRAQGVAMAAALTRDIPVFEYAPRKIKLSITGMGAASKEQVAGFLGKILKIDADKLPKNLDSTDGLAVAMCHYYQSILPTQAASSYKGWGDFVKKNPNKIK